MVDLLKDLNLEQKQAVQHSTGHLLIVAGAGTGKTTVITRKIAYLITKKKINADKILALTFTDKAAGEMEDRVNALLPIGYLDLWISTFHSFCERILQQHALDIGIPSNFKLLSETEQWLLIREHLDDLKLDYYQPKGNPTKFIAALISHFSRLKDENISPEQYLLYAENLKLNQDTEDVVLEAKRINELANAYHIYQNLLLKNNSLDFGDLIIYTLKLFKDRPQILKKYQEQFSHILVDEFQDTNIAQYDLIKLLIKSNQLTVVGDDDQSVYKFRGASVSNILAFKKDFPKSEELVLIQNYRSTQNILNLAYNFICLNNPNRLEANLKINKKLLSQNKAKGLIEHLSTSNANEESCAVINKIAELKNNKNSWNDFAILVRANNQAEQFINFLDKAEIPYQFVASKGLYNKPVILDIVAYLKMLDNYHESRALYRVLNIPVFNLQHEEIMLLLNYANKKTLSLYESLQQARIQKDLNSESVIKIEKILNLIEKHTKHVTQKTIGEIVLMFLQDSGYLKHLTSSESQQNREYVLYLNQFYKYIEKFEQASQDKSVKRFITELNMIEDAGDSGSLKPNFDEGPETVKIMTVHSAKGLEFDYVFIVNLVDKRFPSIEKSELIAIPEELIKETIPEGDVHLEEERRLFYVAMTRAKKGIFFTSAEDYGGTRKKKPSRFLTEIDLVPKEEKHQATGEVFFDTSNKKIPSNKQKIIEKIPDKFSFTQLKAYETCPWQYRFAHILKIPVPGKPSLSFGKTIHHTLCDFFKKLQEIDHHQQQNFFSNEYFEKKSKKSSQETSLVNLLKIYENNWLDDWYYSKKNKKEYFDKGKEILTKFYELHENNWPAIKFLEKGFNLKIDNYLIKGQIDRIDSVKNGVEIIDYKTGNLPKIKKDIEQLQLYALAVKEIFQDNPMQMTYYYLEENKTLSYEVKQEDLKKVKVWILEKIENILKNDFTPTPGFHCKYCDFYSICDHRK